MEKPQHFSTALSMSDKEITYLPSCLALEDFLRSRNVNGITCDTKPPNDIDRAVIFFKLFVFLYADYTALVAESAKDLQYALNTFKIYCTT